MMRDNRAAKLGLEGSTVGGRMMLKNDAEGHLMVFLCRINCCLSR